MSSDPKDPLLYQNLPSIKPRVSREERATSRRKGYCPDCQPSLNKAKKSAKNLYYFFISLLAIGFIGVQLYQKQNKTETVIKEQSKSLSISFSQKISMTLVDQSNRQGISLLLRNNSSNPWNIDTIDVRSPSHNFSQKIELFQSIPKKDFYSLFISLPENIDNINDIDISLKP